jgi:hypothetical protein
MPSNWGPWLGGVLDKTKHLLAMVLFKWKQGDGVYLQKCNPRANGSLRIGVINPCLERAK